MGGIWGQDWASYQSAQPDTSGLSFAFIKVTEGESYENPHWIDQYRWARSQGLVVGLYHYPHMGNSVGAELDYFLSTITAGIGAPPPEVMLCLDWEGYDPANQGVPHTRQVAYKDEFLHSLKGRQPHNAGGAYMNADYRNNVDTTGYYGDYLWIATAGRPAGQPGISAPWLFHQYGDTPVDSDYCHLGSTAELRAWAQSFAANPQEDIVTPQDYQAIAQAVWAHTETNADTGQPVYMGAVMAWMDKVHNSQVDRITAQFANQIAATNAAITALATQLGQVHGVDTATVVAAVQKAVADATVHVQVAVTGTPAPAPSA